MEIDPNPPFFATSDVGQVSVGSIHLRLCPALWLRLDSDLSSSMRSTGYVPVQGLTVKAESHAAKFTTASPSHGLGPTTPQLF